MGYEGRRNKLFLRKDLRLGEWVELRYVEMSDILQSRGNMHKQRYRESPDGMGKRNNSPCIAGKVPGGKGRK